MDIVLCSKRQMCGNSKLLVTLSKHEPGPKEFRDELRDEIRDVRSS